MSSILDGALQFFGGGAEARESHRREADDRAQRDTERSLRSNIGKNERRATGATSRAATHRQKAKDFMKRGQRVHAQRELQKAKLAERRAVGIENRSFALEAMEDTLGSANEMKQDVNLMRSANTQTRKAMRDMDPDDVVEVMEDVKDTMGDMAQIQSEFDSIFESGGVLGDLLDVDDGELDALLDEDRDRGDGEDLQYDVDDADIGQAYNDLQTLTPPPHPLHVSSHTRVQGGSAASRNAPGGSVSQTAITSDFSDFI